MNLNISEIALLVEALSMAASRHESQARFAPSSARPHDDKAERMRELRRKLLGFRQPTRAAK